MRTNMYCENKEKAPRATPPDAPWFLNAYEDILPSKMFHVLEIMVNISVVIDATDFIYQGELEKI